jgi:hypothetical protein
VEKALQGCAALASVVVGLAMAWQIGIDTGAL